jgi:LPXTG-motif cell wall-anchored protein
MPVEQLLWLMIYLGLGLMALGVLVMVVRKRR